MEWLEEIRRWLRKGVDYDFPRSVARGAMKRMLAYIDYLEANERVER